MKRKVLWCEDCQCAVYLCQQPDGTLILVGGGGRIHAVGLAALIVARREGRS